VIALEQVTKRFNGRDILRGIDLHVARGETPAILLDDEPTAGLKSTVVDALITERHEDGFTQRVVTHDLTTAHTRGEHPVAAA
jgi:ABC-type transporter Mla maintaining outer membrane lipid asymmetry ATPase subunit MlaF